MKSGCLFTGMLAMNVVVLISNGKLADAFRRFETAAIMQLERVVDSADRELDLERARVGMQLRKLEDLLAAARSTQLAPSASGSVAADLKLHDDEYLANAVYRRPDPATMELLSDEEMGVLRELRRQMPEAMAMGLLLAGDVDSVLEDRTWNPEGKEVDDLVRRELSALMSDYRYYARVAFAELLTAKKKRIPALRSAGAYLTYGAKERPNLAKPVAISHAELAEDGDHWRLYLFPRDEYPELHHHRDVSLQQQLAVGVHIFQLINGAPEPGT